MTRSKYSLFDNFEYKGSWWLPENPANKVAGTLVFNKSEGITLELIGSLRPSEPLSSSSDFTPMMILGMTTDGNRCTLLDNLLVNTKSNIFPDNISSERFECEYLFVGYHFYTEEDVQFSALKVNYTYLEEWMDQQPFSVEYEKYPDCTINYSRPIPVEISIPCYDTTIRVTSSVSTHHDFYRTVRIDHSSFLGFYPQTSQSLNWYLELIFNIRNLLMLMMGEPTYYKKILGLIDREISDEVKPRKEFVNIYFSQSTPNEIKKFRRSDMLLPMSLIEAQISEIFETWLSNSNELHSVYNLFSSYLYHSDFPVDFGLLSLMQALESFHRVTKPGNYLDKEEYSQKYGDALISALPDDTPSDLKMALKSRIKYGYQYSLRKRLNEIFDDIEGLKSLVTSDHKEFVNKVVNFRNYLTHYDEDERPSDLDIENMYTACQSLRILLTIVLLRNLDISDDIIKKVISNNRRLRRWIGR
jgi:hypothetical protein